jgi:hypothetical protein
MSKLKLAARIILPAVLVSSPYLAWGAVSQLVFTSQVVQVGVGVVSDKLTVQAQNSSGTSEQITDTAYLILTSSSPTGEFSSSATTWKPVTQLTMSKNTANRNFYYRDQTAGQATITITAKDQSWSPAVLTLTIGAGGGSVTTETGSGDNGDDNSNDNSDTTESHVSTGAASAHAGQTALSTEDEKLTWKITAGRPRRALTETPIIFQARTVAGEPTGGISYYWSFGDGASFSGRDAIHNYRFPGVYQVVVNGRSGNDTAVARTIVTIEAPKLSIDWVPGNYAAQIVNRYTLEVNLGGFRIASGPSTILVIPNDTIIAGNATVDIPLPGGVLAGQLGITNLALYSPIGTEVSMPLVVPLAPLAQKVVIMAAPAAVTQIPVPTATSTVIELNSARVTWWEKFISWFKS